ncbi:hypothetical protein HYW75_04455 [Candidatus Pacearchaeota archaeon]|nr:hypothetical protein [Candidatus Pacearchaeota archaeon]
MNEETRKKNILDLQFQKYLIVSSTSSVIAFAYFIGVGIAVAAKQILLNDFVDMTFIFIISSGILGVCSFIFFNALFHINNILGIIKKL